MPVKPKPVNRDFFNFDQGDLAVVARMYGLEPFDTCYPILLDGVVGTLLEVRSQTSRKIIVGSGGRKYFLKQIPWYCNDEASILLSHSLQTKLYDSGVPVARLLETRDGTSWVDVAGVRLTLHEHIDGFRFRGSLKEVGSAADALARLHLKSVLPMSPTESLFALVEEHVHLVENVLNSSLNGDIRYGLGQLVVNVRIAEEACNNLGLNDVHSRGVHGDYNPWNVLYDAHREVSAILDFDNSDVGSRLHDVAEGLLGFCFMEYEADSTNFSNQIPRSWRADHLQSFLTSYHSRFPLSEVEIECLPWICKIVLIELFCLGVLRSDFELQLIDHMIALTSQNAIDLWQSISECIGALHNEFAVV